MAASINKIKTFAALIKPATFWRSKIPIFKLNLFVIRSEQPKLYIRLLRWILSSGRFIVVIIELIVIGAFVLRYKLDTDLLDLQEKIKEQIPYLQSLKNDETAIKQTQFRLDTIKQTKHSTPNLVKTLLKISQLTPTTVKLTNITVNKPSVAARTTLTITGQAPTTLELSVYLKALQKNPEFTDITLTNISFEGLTTFTIIGVLTGQGGTSS